MKTAILEIKNAIQSQNNDNEKESIIAQTLSTLSERLIESNDVIGKAVQQPINVQVTNEVNPTPVDIKNEVNPAEVKINNNKSLLGNFIITNRLHYAVFGISYPACGTRLLLIRQAVPHFFGNE